MLARSQQSEVNPLQAVWYLGIDFGTTGMSAVLLDSSTSQYYPIYWSNEYRTIAFSELQAVNPRLATRHSEGVVFRLPTKTDLGSASNKLPSVLPLVIGSSASKSAQPKAQRVLDNVRPFLSLSIPFYSPKRGDWEPIFQLSEQEFVSLYSMRCAVQALLATLTPKNTLPDATINVGAVGLAPDTLATALGKLTGVILGYPADWGDTYHFNLREAILAIKLVRHPEQIFFLPDAIAPILAGLLSSHTEGLKRKSEELRTENSVTNLSASPPLHVPTSSKTASPHPPVMLWRGGTLVINAGTTSTEFAVAALPIDLQALTSSDFSSYSLPYGGSAIDQDIFCQLLYPQLSTAQYEQLGLRDDLELPLPGQPDRAKRDRLTYLLYSSSFGKALLKASSYLKLILQRKDEFTLELGSDRWTVRRLDLETRVMQPLIQQLDRILNALMIETGVSQQGIYNVFWVGGTAASGTLTQWIQQRLPGATFIQDADSVMQNWVAAGLAALPLYPQILNRSQQQYSDYFLLLELLRAFSMTTGDATDRAYSLEEIVQRLERRGLNTNACYDRLVRLIQGSLPLGLTPALGNDCLLSQQSQGNLHYSRLASRTGLFSHEGDGLYRPNLQQQEWLRHYLDVVLSRAYQKFEEPLIVRLGTPGY
jgi:hypothetical protein